MSLDRLPIEPKGKGTKLGEGFPKVRLSQDRLPIEPLGNGKKLGEGRALS